MADFEGTKELNLDENVSLEELGRLRLENRDLQLAREKLVKKLDKKKNELENEKTHTTTLRQLIQELNRKVELLEREPIPVISPLRIDPGAGLTGEVVERLVMEKTGLESNLAEQKTEIETLKSEITSMDTKIVLTNQKLEIARGENARFEKLVPELKLELSKKENECKRLSMSTNNADETSETDTLKTRLQDLSITNKHYLSQLQKKDLTIATTTNKFDTEKQQILELSRLEIEKLKQNETSLNEQLIKVKRELDQKCSALEDDKSVLEIQVDVLNGQIGELSEERERCKGRVVELETTLTDLQLQLQKLGEVQQNETATVQNYEQQITELTNQFTILNNELTSVKDSASISKQLINKLNQDIEVLETNKDNIQQRLNDKTSETETLKTRLQDQSITNKHYLSQLQKKDLTIATTTNKFDTEKQQILELSRLEIEKLKQNETSLNEQLIKVKRELDQKCSALEDDKSVLEIQVDVLNGQIGELSEERERCKGRVVELETTLTDLQLQLQKLGEVQQNETATVQNYEQQITELTNQFTILNNELTSVKDSASISKQLINKLNQDIEVLETNKDNIQQRLNDKTSETETLKTRLQDQSITNKHYLSQLQKKDLTIATTTNKFETEKQQILELSRLEIEKLKQNETSLNEQLISAKAELQKSKNEIEDTLQTELKESRDEVFLLKTETNQQKETIDKQNEVIETYKRQQISAEEYKASETKDKQMSRYHYPFQSPASLPTHSIGSNTKPPVIEQPWKCLFCGATYPSERERDIHMTDSCNNAPTCDDQSIVTQHRPPMGRPPMMKAHTPLGYLPYRPPFQQRERQLESPQAALMELTPELIPQANKTGKSPVKMAFRGTLIYVVQLKAFPNPTESYNKQVICLINKRSELGVLMCIKGLSNILPKYAGIKLYNPVGNCDGTYKDKRYFDCPPNCGIFVPLEDVYVPVP